MLWIEIVAFKGDVRIRGGQQGKPKPLAGAEFEDALGMEGASWRSADAERRECHVAGRGLSIETRGVAEVRNIAAGPVHSHADEVSRIIALVATHGASGFGVVLDHVERGRALGRAVSLRQPGIDDKPIAVLHQSDAPCDRAWPPCRHPT
jgi:hypothetical protein